MPWMPMKIAVIEWIDAKGSEQGWSYDDPADIESIQTVGRLERETDKSVTVSLSKSESEAIAGYISIPRVCITKIWIIDAEQGCDQGSSGELSTQEV